MLKLGLRPRYSQKRNIQRGFSLQCSITTKVFVEDIHSDNVITIGGFGRTSVYLGSLTSKMTDSLRAPSPVASSLLY
jgi:hypothetical protein